MLIYQFMYVFKKIGQIQSINQNFDIAIIEKVTNVFPIKNVHFHVYFNIPILITAFTLISVFVDILVQRQVFHVPMLILRMLNSYIW